MADLPKVLGLTFLGLLIIGTLMRGCVDELRDEYPNIPPAKVMVDRAITDFDVMIPDGPNG